MILPVLYAMLIWYLAMRLRRRWSGAASVAAGVLLLIALNRLFSGENPGLLAGKGDRGPNILLVLLWPYTLLVAGVGAFIVCLPRRPPGEFYCQKCHYDFAGLNPAYLVCPECGANWKGKGADPEVPEPELIKPPTHRADSPPL